MTDIAEMMREARKHMNMSQKDAASVIGIHYQTLTKAECGLCTLETLVRARLGLIEAYGQRGVEIVAEAKRQIAARMARRRAWPHLLRAEVARLGMSGYQAAKILGVSNSALYSWMRGREFPGEKTMDAIERQLKGLSNVGK